MSKRRVLLAATAFLGLVAIVIVAVPLGVSLGTSVGTKNNRELPIPLSSIPYDDFKEFDWDGWKVFLKRSPEVTGFLMPFQDGAYRLPDLTWARTAVRCGTFRFEAGFFQCFDKSLASWWLDNARWSESGISPSGYFPPLQTPPFVVEGNDVILGRRPNDR